MMNWASLEALCLTHKKLILIYRESGVIIHFQLSINNQGLETFQNIHFTSERDPEPYWF